jgi:hypothetical protein
MQYGCRGGATSGQRCGADDHVPPMSFDAPFELIGQPGEDHGYRASS